MPKLYHKGSTQPVSAPDAAQLLEVIQTFLATCRTPAVLDLGEPIVPLAPDSFALEIRSNRLWLEFWSEARAISRRILTIEGHTTGVLDCTVHRFGGKPGKLSFLDLDRPQTAHKTTSAVRRNFGEHFRRMLFRQYPGWEVGALSSAMDLQRSFSSVFPRARLLKGNAQIAALACPSPQDEDAFLSFALIWYAYLRARAPSGMSTTLSLFLPENAGTLTAHRLHWLTGSQLSAVMLRFNADGLAGIIDPQDLGNLQTRIAKQFVPPRLTPELQALMAGLGNEEGVGICPELSGALSIRSRGLEFGRIENGMLLLGLEEKRRVDPSRPEEVRNFISKLNGVRSPGAASSRYLSSHSERWLETCVRSQLSAVDSTLIAQTVHGQVLTFAAGDRDLIDLLAVSTSGRLAVLELKASEDIHLPIQALDYWMRVAWHARNAELGHLFPGVCLDARPPKLLLLAPAMSFHSTNPIILRYFSPAIEVERIGVNAEWRQQLKVVMRLNGAAAPISHWSPQ